MSSTSEIKTQLWTVASRLQRAQSKFEHLAQASRTDIASVLTREHQLRSSDASHDDASVEAEKLLASARLKAEKLIVDDEACDLMGILERYCDVLLEGQVTESAAQLDPDCLEAVSGILAASPRVDAPELQTLCHSLAHRYPDLLSEYELRENISLKLVAHLNPGRPSQTTVDTKLVSIAHSHGLSNWAPPELLPTDRERELLALLQSTSSMSLVVIVDERRLRHLCSSGIPSSAPAWLRYRAWSLLLGVLPKDKSTWSTAAAKGRADYAALSQQILEALSSSPPPPDAPVPISTKDKALLQFSKDVEALPVSIRDTLSLCVIPHPHPASNEGSTFNYADAVSSRIFMIKNRNRLGAAHSTQPTPLIPTITLDDPPTSPFSPTTMYSDHQTISATTTGPTVLLGVSSATQGYETILLRLLYIHSMLHSSHATSFGPPTALAAIFAVVLILALQSKPPTLTTTGANGQDPMDMDTLADIEADVFWMVEAIVGNTRELLEGGDEGDEVWTRKFSNVVRWADSELWMDLSRKGLDPALPYYSYRWIPTLFTHTLPLDTLLPIWDAIFSISDPSEGSSQQSVAPPQAEFIYAIGATMLIRARAAIFQTSAAGGGGGGGGQNGLAGGNNPGTVSPSGGLTSFWKRQSRGANEISLPHSPSPYSPIASPKTPQSPTMTAVARDAFDSGGQGALTPGRLSNVFLVAVKLLQEYDVNSFGGTERLLGATWSLWRKWCREGRPLLDATALQDVARYANSSSQGRPTSPMPPVASTGGVAAGLNRLRDLAWKGMTNEVDDDSPSPVEREARPVKPVPPKLTVTSPVSERAAGAGFFSSISGGLGSKLTESVWKGVTNQLDSPDASPDITPEPSPRSSMLVAHDEEMMRGPEKTAMMSSSSWSGVGALSWAKGYAEKLKESETAVNLSRTGTTLRAKASTVWTRDAAGQTEQQRVNGAVRGVESPPPTQAPAGGRPQSGTMSPATSSVGSWGEMFSRRGSLPFSAALVGDTRKRESSESGRISSPAPQREFADISKRDSYSPPNKPSHFRAARDSVMGSLFSPVASTPELSQLPTSPPSAAEGGVKNPLQAALAALSGGSPKVDTAPKRGPKPLLLNSGSLITRSGSRSGLNSRTPSRRPSPIPSPTPTPRPGDRFSLSTEGEDSTVNKSGFVSLRRGPLTNPRTAGYGVSSTSREGTRSSRASTSSGISSPAFSAKAFPIDLESEEEPRGRAEAKKQNRGFFIDQGAQLGVNESGPERAGVSLVDPPVTIAAHHASSSDEDQSFGLESAGISTSTRVRSKRSQNRPAPITTASPAMSTNHLPELMITTPRSSDSSKQASHPQDAEDLTITGTPAPAAKGATLSRSRSSTRRMKRPRQGSGEKRGAHDENRDSMLSVGPSGSEEEGARADVEDLDDIYDMY